MDTLVTDIIGMIGTVLVVLAYYLLQLEKLDPKGLNYNLLNLVGAVFLLISLMELGNTIDGVAIASKILKDIEQPDRALF